MIVRNHPLYSTYSSMKSRCYNKNNKSYYRYGGRGIIVCERWLKRKEGFYNFISDMGDRPKGYSLDRIDNNLNYTPENCRWANAKTQANNRNERYFVKNRSYYERNSNFCIYKRKDRQTYRVQIRLKEFRPPIKCFKRLEDAIIYRNSMFQNFYNIRKA